MKGEFLSPKIFYMLFQVAFFKCKNRMHCVELFVCHWKAGLSYGPTIYCQSFCSPDFHKFSPLGPQNWYILWKKSRTVFAFYTMVQAILRLNVCRLKGKLEKIRAWKHFLLFKYSEHVIFSQNLDWNITAMCVFSLPNGVLLSCLKAHLEYILHYTDFSVLRLFRVYMKRPVIV